MALDKSILNGLNKHQAAERNIMMYAYDMNLMYHNPDWRDPATGKLKAELEAERNAYEQTLVQELHDGSTIGATYESADESTNAFIVGDTVRGVLTEDGHMVGVPFQEGLFDTNENDEFNAIVDDITRSLYLEYHAANSTARPPFDVDENGENLIVSKGMVFPEFEASVEAGAPNIQNIRLYTEALDSDYDDDNELSSIFNFDGSGLYYRNYQEDLDDAHEFGADSATASVQPQAQTTTFNTMSNEAQAEYNVLYMNSYVMAVNDYVRTLDNGRPLRISEAQNLHDYAKIIEDGGSLNAEDVARRLNEFGYNVDTASISSVLDGIDTEDIRNHANRLHDNRFTPVDVFGTTRILRNDIPVANLDTIHALINGDRDEIKRSIETVQQLDEDVRIYPEPMSMHRYPVSKDGNVHISSGTGLYDIEGNLVNYSEAGTMTAYGHEFSRNDNLGLSRLRPYMKSADYAKLHFTANNNQGITAEVQNRMLDGAVAVLETLNDRGIEYTVSDDIHDGELKCSFRVANSQPIDVRLIDMNNPAYCGRVYGDNLESYYSSDLTPKAYNETQLEQLRKIIGNGRDGTYMINDKPVYVPSPEEMADIVKYRLGEDVKIVGPTGEEESLGEAGIVMHQSGKPLTTNIKVEGENGRPSYQKKDRLKVHSSESNNNVHVRTIQSAYINRDEVKPTTFTTLKITTRMSSRVNSATDYDEKAPVEYLERMMASAKDNVRNQVFSDLEGEISKTVPDYKADKWNSYVKTPRKGHEDEYAQDAEGNYLRDEQGRLLSRETNEPIIWKTNSRSNELLASAGADASDISQVRISDDPVIRTMQTQYLEYLEREDAMLRGVVDGHVTEESLAEFNSRIQAAKIDDEINETASDAEKKLLDTLFGDTDENFDKTEKFGIIQEHYGMLSDTMFGEIEPSGRMVINVANVIKYSGAEEKDVFRAIQAAKQQGADIAFVSEDDAFTMNRLREHTVTFNPETAVSMNSEAFLSEHNLMSTFRDVMVDTVEKTGCEIDTLEIDDKGIVHYVVTRPNGQAGHNGKTEIEGTLGQIFDVDERGVIQTNFNHDNNYSIIPGYSAYVKNDRTKTFDENTVYQGYSQKMCQAIEYNMRTQLLSVFQSQDAPKATKESLEALNRDMETVSKAASLDSLNATALNGVYRHLNDRKLSLDYMSELQASGASDEFANAFVETFNGAVRFPSEYIEESTINATVSAEKANFVDDQNVDPYTLTGRDISCLELSTPGLYDRVATSTGTVQGATRYLTRGAMANMDPVTGTTKPSDDVNDKTPVLAIPECENNEYNPFDRQQMVFSNLTQALQVSKANVVHMDFGGWNMDDGNVVSQDWANRHLVRVEDVEASKNLDPQLIENLLEKDENGDVISEISADYQHNTVKFMGETFNVSDAPMTLIELTDVTSEHHGETRLVNTRDLDKYPEKFAIATDENGVEIPSRNYSYAEQIKQQYIERHEGIRPLEVGDKICDFNGNKGVITLVVDKDMPADKAERLQLTKEVEFFKANPDLDVVSAPYTAPSRFNGGTVRSMMENPRPIKILDGQTVEGAMGELPLIITDKTVDEKTHLYDDDLGRKVSSQLGWALQAKHADKFLDAVFDNNTRNLTAVREKMIALGCDFDDEFNMSKGYTPHAGEERPIISLEVPDFHAEIVPSGKTQRFSIDREAVAQARQNNINKLMSSGGFMEVPFEVELASGIKTTKDETTGKYLLPVLPVQYRMDQKFDDGVSMVNNLTRQYIDIANIAMDYYEAEAKVEAARIAGNEKISLPNPEFIAGKAQDSYNKLKYALEPSFEGKHNVWKHNVMSHNLGDNDAYKSSTSVLTADPRLNIEEIGLSKAQAEKLNLMDGDRCVIWRDPLLRPEGVAAVTVKIRSDEDLQLKGVAINPAFDKRFDGDFDGDTIAIVSMNTVDNATRRKFAEFEAAADKKAFLAENKRFNPDKIKAALDRDAEIIADTVKAIGVENTLYDLGPTPDSPESKNQIALSINSGLDVASALAVMHERGDSAVTVDAEGKPCFKGFEDAKEAIYLSFTADSEELKASKKHEALKDMNDTIHTALDNAYGSDIIRYGSMTDYLESLNTVIVDHKAKGKIGKFGDIAAYLNISAELTEDGSRIDTSKPVIDFGAPSIENDGSGKYAIEVDGKRTEYEASDDEIKKYTGKTYAECVAERHEDMVDRYKNVEKATAIKSFGTGIAGSYSQRAVKSLRDDCILPCLETTYGATQGLLQAKHSAVEAANKYEILRETLPALWRGQCIHENEDGKWVVDTEVKKDGKVGPKYASKEEWVDCYKALCDSKNGLDFPIDRSRLEQVAQHIYGIDDRGYEKLMVNVYKEDHCAPLDVLAYGGNAQTMYDLCDDKANLFKSFDGTESSNRFFAPQGSIYSANREVKNTFVKEQSQVYSVDAAKERAAERKTLKAPAKVAEDGKIIGTVVRNGEAIARAEAEAKSTETTKDITE